MQSKITNGPTEKIFSARVLNKYDVDYFRCLETGFIQTEEPYWLEEAYSSAITKLDIGLIARNEELRDKVIPILNNYFNADSKFLDYAGGYGVFTRQMRDKGFDFYHTDIYCQNLFAEYFDLVDLSINSKFELVTAFEVFEHLPDPANELATIGKFSDNILFSTVLQPEEPLKSVSDWWYFIPETGQHISLFTAKSLAVLGEKFGYNYYSDGVATHLFTKQKLDCNPFEQKRDPFLIRKMRKMMKKFELNQVKNRTSLLQTDWQHIKNKLS